MANERADTLAEFEKPLGNEAGKSLVRSRTAYVKSLNDLAFSEKLLPKRVLPANQQAQSLIELLIDGISDDRWVHYGPQKW